MLHKTKQTKSRTHLMLCKNFSQKVQALSCEVSLARVWEKYIPDLKIHGWCLVFQRYL